MLLYVLRRRRLNPRLNAKVKTDVILQAVAGQLGVLLASGENWTLTLHGGRGGDVKVEVRTVAELVGRAGGMALIEERSS